METTYKDWYHSYVTAEHIFRKSQEVVSCACTACSLVPMFNCSPEAEDAEIFGIDVEHPKNGLPMLRHVELYHDDLDLTFIPCEDTRCNFDQVALQ
eukprot:1572953-Amphidinium_carterae.1